MANSIAPCRRSRFAQSINRIERLADFAGFRQRYCSPRKPSAKLRLLNLEDRVVPTDMSKIWTVSPREMFITVGQTVSFEIGHGADSKAKFSSSADAYSFPSAKSLHAQSVTVSDNNFGS